ncbi:unnamed protein product [Ectocarpus sp. 13 AM-2016]
MLPFRTTAVLTVGFGVVHRRGCPRANDPLPAAAVLPATQAPVSEPVGVSHLPAAGGARRWWCSGRLTRCCRYQASSGPGTARLPRISGGGGALLCRRRRCRYHRLCYYCRRRRRWGWRRWRRRRLCCRWFAPHPVAQFAHRAPLGLSALLRRHSAVWWVRGGWAAREGQAMGWGPSGGKQR